MAGNADPASKKAKGKGLETLQARRDCRAGVLQVGKRVENK
jgi:hypothetical protein